MKSKFTTSIFKQQLESIQLMSKLQTNIQFHQAFIVNYFYNETRSTLWRWPPAGQCYFVVTDMICQPASQPKIASKLWNHTASKMITTGHCNLVRKKESKSMHPLHRMQQLINHWVECHRWSISDLLHLR